MHPFLRFFGIAITLFVVAVCGRWAYEAALQPSPVTVIVALGISLFWLFSIRMMATSTSVTPRGKYTEKGTLIQPDIRIDRNLNRLVITGTLATGVCAAAWPLGALYVPLIPPELSYVVPLIASAVGVVCLWMWWKSSTQGGLSLLMLTPEGFKFPTIGSMREGRWEDIASIEDKLPDEEKFWNPMVITMDGGSTVLFEAPGIYTDRGTALVELVRFYWQHPEQRVELTDGRALKRLDRLQSV